MPVARVASGFLKHFGQILETWAGKAATHRKITETIDEMGQVIDQSYTDTTIYGIISPIDLKTNNSPIGHVAPGDLTALFKYSDGVIISDQLTSTTIRHDHIIYEGVEYQIYNVEWAYDVKTSQVDHEPVFGNFHLKKITNN